MKRPSIRRRYVIGAVVTAIAAGAIAAPVLAASGSGSGTSTAPAHPPATGRPWGAGRAIRQQYQADLAAKLGITTAKLEAAQKAVLTAMRPPTPGVTPVRPAARRKAFETALAAKLGISAATLATAQDAARQSVILANLSTLVSRGVLTQAEANQLRAAATAGTFDATLHNIEIAKLTARLDEAVKAGWLTQAQANKILARAKSASAAGGLGLGLGLRLGFGVGMGGPGGRMGPGPWRRGAWGPPGAPPHGAGSGASTTLAPMA